MSDTKETNMSPALPNEVVHPRARTDNTSVSDASRRNSKPSRPIPTMGFPALWYKVARRFNRNVNPPKLSKNEQDILAAKASVKYSREQIDICRNLSIVFIGVKGDAATTTSMVNSSSIFANDTRSLVYGADFNPASGTAGARLGKDYGQTVSIQKFAKIVDKLRDDRRAVNATLRPTRYGVRVLSADNYTDIPGEQYGTTTSVMLEVLTQNCDYLFLDSPNDITTPAARAILQAVDMIVFTANVGERDSLRLLRVSMDTVRELGYRNKVVNSVVAISNTQKGATIEDYKKYLGHVDLKHEPTGDLMPGEFDGQMILIPHDPVIALNDEVDIEAYRYQTVQAYRDLNIAIFEQAIRRKFEISQYAPKTSH